jgi:hypothetical protein
MGDLAGDAELPAGIVFDRDRKVDTVFKILFNRFDDRNFAIEGDIEDVSFFAGMQAYSITSAKA